MDDWLQRAAGIYHMCGRKRIYETEADAKCELVGKGGVQLRAYHCPNCNYWHRTRKAYEEPFVPMVLTPREEGTMAIKREELYEKGFCFIKTRYQFAAGGGAPPKGHRVQVLEINRGAARVKYLDSGKVFMAKFSELEPDHEWLDQRDREEEEKKRRIRSELRIVEAEDLKPPPKPLTYKLGEKLVEVLDEREEPAAVASEDARAAALRAIEALKSNPTSTYENAPKPAEAAAEVAEAVVTAWPKQEREERDADKPTAFGLRVDRKREREAWEFPGMKPEEQYARDGNTVPAPGGVPAPQPIPMPPAPEPEPEPEPEEPPVITPRPEPTPPPAPKADPLTALLEKVERELEVLIGDEEAIAGSVASAEKHIARLQAEIAAAKERLERNRTQQKVLAAKERTLRAMQKRAG